MRAALVVVLLAAVAPALAAGPVAVTDAAQLSKLTRDTARSLSRAQAVRGGFVQKRHLAGLARPLESDGSFLFARGTGIEWHTQRPFDSQFVLTADGMTQRDEGGDTLRVSVSDQPALTVVSRVFFALFALDFAALWQDFTMTGTDPGNGPWQLRLMPKTAALGSVFRQALVMGDATVTSVRLEDANGDVTEIELRDVQYDRKGLTPDERRRF